MELLFLKKMLGKKRNSELGLSEFFPPPTRTPPPCFEIAILKGPLKKKICLFFDTSAPTDGFTSSYVKILLFSRCFCKVVCCRLTNPRVNNKGTVLIYPTIFFVSVYSSVYRADRLKISTLLFLLAPSRGVL